VMPTFVAPSLRRMIGAALLLAAALMLFPTVAGAHADPIRMDPGIGGVVFLPAENGAITGSITVRTWLSERAERNFTFFEVHDPAGERVDVAGSLTLESQGAIVTVGVAPKRIGEHRISYRILSAVDGHTNQGNLTFFVAEATPGMGSALAALPGELVVRTPAALGAQSISITLLKDGSSVLSGQGAFSRNGDADVARIELPQSAPGTYEVRWELSTNSGPKFGVYSFTVGGS